MATTRPVRLIVSLGALEGGPFPRGPSPTGRRMEFHISRRARDNYDFDEELFASDGNVVFADFRAARVFAHRMNSRNIASAHPDRVVKAGRINAMGLVDEILHHVVGLYRGQLAPDCMSLAMEAVRSRIGEARTNALLCAFTREFPPAEVYRRKTKEEEYLAGGKDGVPNALLALEELAMLALANENPALGQFRELFDDAGIPEEDYAAAVEAFGAAFAALPPFGPDNESLLDMLRAPMRASPHSLTGQLDYMRTHWGLMLGSYLSRLLGGADMMREEDKPYFPGPGPTRAYVYEGMDAEYERFTPDADWMPNVVMIAKTVLVWLHQLSASYGREITRLDQIPDEELDRLVSRGFNTLWLIGLWERSEASARIKRICGNPEAASSAYSLFDYDIASELGGWSALENLKERALWRGLRLAADMVPNHSGIDSRWMRERPELFLQRRDPPFPSYTFSGENLSGAPGIGVYLEDHYYARSDAAVVFKRVDFATGDTRYIYHGNDGTSMPWNDTAQIDFLNKDAREAVMERILHVARCFPVIRFDAAMTLARRHFRRLWYPEPGSGGDIASRHEFALDRASFDRAMPEEFWREVVDRCAREAPDTLLLAEAFWMMEGYFVRTLGMHRVYNSAFMNMLKRQENAKYRETIRNTQEFDTDILKRFVNFMNNPDEETAEAQFGKGDKYFAVCTMMVTMPGLPMFGHGQVEGFTEKYGMEYRRAYRDEAPDRALVERHEREIFPLMKRRYLFSGVADFRLYDFFDDAGQVNENVFAYSNSCGDERSLVTCNNAFERAAGWIRLSSAFASKAKDGTKKPVREDLAHALGLRREANRFAFMREQRSGLWFVRDSLSLSEKGLFAILEGYQTQVFLDVHERTDNEFGHYRVLCERLAGSGIPDVEVAVQDIFLAKLYEALEAFASPEFLSLFSLAEGSGADMDGGFQETMETNAGAFYKAACLEIESPDAWPSFSIKSKKAPRCDGIAAWEHFLARINALLDFIELAKASIDGAGPNAGAIERTSPYAFFAREAQTPPVVAAYLVLDALKSLVRAKTAHPAPAGEAAAMELEVARDARRLADHWGIDRKLRESLEAAQVPAELAWRDMNALKAASCAVAGLAWRTPAGFARELARRIDSDAEAQALTGVNSYDAVVWTDRDKLARFADLAATLAAIERLAAEGSTADHEKTCSDAFAFAAEASRLVSRAAEEAGFRWLTTMDILSRTEEMNNARRKNAE